LKNKATAKIAIAAGVRKAWEPLFKANEKANELGPAELKGLLSQVSGADEKMVDWNARTFAAFAKLADFNVQPAAPPQTQTPIRTTSNVVLVPALVKTRDGDTLFSLNADDFYLTDNRAPQKSQMEPDRDAQPLARRCDRSVNTNLLGSVLGASSIGFWGARVPSVTNRILP
jgi:hypothetical protein